MYITFKDAVKLKKKSEAIKSGLILVEGKRLIGQLIKNHISILQLFIGQEENIKQIQKKYRCKTILVLSDKKLQRLSSVKTPQRIVAVVKGETKKIDKRGFLLFLDGISEPGNLGTIIRSCSAFGINGVVLSKNSCWIFNPKVIRSSMGEIFNLPIEYWDYQKLKMETNSTIISTSPTFGIELNDFITPKNNIILCLGSEAFGCSKELLKFADKNIYIKMDGCLESLNVSTSAAILLYKLRNVDKIN